jgi:hypothetical protein
MLGDPMLHFVVAGSGRGEEDHGSLRSLA